MPQNGMLENRSGPRYVHNFPIRAEWDTSDGGHIVAEGETENVGPEGTLIHLQRELPPVGGRVSLRVMDDNGEKLSVIAEVLRIERNPARPQAALQLLGETDEWRGLIWDGAPVFEAARATRLWCVQLGATGLLPPHPVRAFHPVSRRESGDQSRLA